MPPSFEELDYSNTPLGELILRRRRVLSLGKDVYEVKLADALLMSSLVNESEIALAEVTLRDLRGRECDVLVGGLGLGHTAAAALDVPGVRSVSVVELLPAVIDWHRRGLVPLAKKLTEDSRCQFIEDDFFRYLDTGSDDSRFDAILLDIDHNPDAFLHPENANFYEIDGLRRILPRLRPAGVFGLWSGEPADDDFLSRLREVLPDARAHEVEFFNPLTMEDEVNCVYVGSREE